MTDVEADDVGSGDINADAEGPGYGILVRDVEADGVVSETLALRKELGSGSDLTGCKMVNKDYDVAWVMSVFQGECAVECRDYSEARLISMVMVEFQNTGLR
ncbi:Golgin Subfamily B Member 1 [Manis pentadactyla]|nr:Golgin Subfamily B Member 1 [Manis pentadactyla]